MVHIENGRDHFWQWDLDQRLIVDNPTVEEVHFSNAMSESALVCEVREENGVRYANVPNILLQSALCISAYSYCDGYTVVNQRFNVIERTRPDDYVYTETQVMRWQDLEQRVKDGVGYYVPNVDADGNLSWTSDNPLLPSVETVNVKGTKGEPGAPGSDANVTKENVEAALGYEPLKGLSIAGNTVQPNVGVADIPIMSPVQVGVARVPAWSGLTIDSSNLFISESNESRISLRNHYYPITPFNMDYAVKAAMCDGKGAAWTDEEKLAARERLGIGNYELIDSFVLESDVSSISRNKTPDGRSYSFSMLIADVISNGVSAKESINAFFKLNDTFNTESVAVSLSDTPNKKSRFFADVSHGFLDARYATGTFNNTSNPIPYQMLQTYELANIDKITKLSIVAAGGKNIPAGFKINIYGVWA